MTDFLKRDKDGDRTFDTLPPPVCRIALEAAVRRLAEIHGSIETAVYVQRIADLCAGHLVLPIDHWRQTSPAAPTGDSQKNQRLRDRLAFAFTYGMGLFIGVIIGATYR